MLNFPRAVRIWLGTAAVNLRRSFDRLAEEVRQHLHNDPLSGHIFVFRFFELTVRIQTDRGQQVIDTGPYAVVRHPGYVGGFFMVAGIALSLGSLWALLPAGLASASLILRTRWEDRTLHAELPGYKEYTERVRYKLIPGVW